jgi:hypothetical protein
VHGLLHGTLSIGGEFLRCNTETLQKRKRHKLIACGFHATDVGNWIAIVFFLHTFPVLVLLMLDGRAACILLSNTMATPSGDNETVTLPVGKATCLTM